MEVSRNGSRPSLPGPNDNFTGAARRDPLFKSVEPSRIEGGQVTFEPGARTRWHTHPVGQILIILAGCGRVGIWGGKNVEVGPGDVIRFAPHEKHWHGASPSVGMTHISVAEVVNGRATDWMEPVSDSDYAG